MKSMSMLEIMNTTAYVCCKFSLKVHKRENFLGFDFEICTFS
jgi:hypothetical protein